MGINRSLLTGACFGMLLLQGCFLPSRTIHSAVYRGHLMDAETKQPISKARVEIRGAYHMTATSKSDSSGAFSVGPLDCWRWCFYVPCAEGRIPMDCRHVMPDEIMFSLEVSRSGYEPARVFVPMYGTNWSRELFIGNIMIHPDRRK